MTCATITWKPPDISSLHNVTFNRHQPRRVHANLIFQKVIRSAATRAPILGGAKRDRTADPLLAKQVLSQLSYSPEFFCPHAAAACAASLRTGAANDRRRPLGLKAILANASGEYPQQLACVRRPRWRPGCIAADTAVNPNNHEPKANGGPGKT